MREGGGEGMPKLEGWSPNVWPNWSPMAEGPSLHPLPRSSHAHLSHHQTAGGADGQRTQQGARRVDEEHGHVLGGGEVRKGG